MSSHARTRTRRLATVYDLAALQLHADGSRAAPSRAPPTSASASTPTSSLPAAATFHACPVPSARSRRTRTTTLDARGNAIARDAAGPMRVKKDVYTRVDIKRENDGPPPVCGDDREGGEYFDLESDGNADDRDGKGDLDMDKAENDQDKEKDQPYIDGGGRTLRKRKPKLSVPSPLPSPPRPVKKRKLVDVAREKVEERFLAGPAVRGAGPAVRGLGLGGVQLPVLVDGTPDVVEASHPSGELLKIIHRFTSQYYTERSLLSNASRFHHHHHNP